MTPKPEQPPVSNEEVQKQAQEWRDNKYKEKGK